QHAESYGMGIGGPVAAAGPSRDPPRSSDDGGAEGRVIGLVLMTEDGIARSDRMSGPLRVLLYSLIALGILLRVLLATHRNPINVDEGNVIDHALRLFAEGPNPR